MREQFEAWLYVNRNEVWSLSDFVWHAYQAGHAAGRAEAEALLREAVDTIDTLPGYPKGADLCDRIDTFLQGSDHKSAEQQIEAVEALVREIRASGLPADGPYWKQRIDAFLKGGTNG